MNDVVAVVTDLFFTARIAAAARAADRSLGLLTSAEAVERVSAFRLALVDLDAGLDVNTAIRVLKACASGPVVAFGPHLDTTGRKAARAAGADRVLAKSKLVTELPVLMRQASSAARPAP